MKGSFKTFISCYSIEVANRVRYNFGIFIASAGIDRIDFNDRDFDNWSLY